MNMEKVEDWLGARARGKLEKKVAEKYNEKNQQSKQDYEKKIAELTLGHKTEVKNQFLEAETVRMTDKHKTEPKIKSIKQNSNRNSIDPQKTKRYFQLWRIITRHLNNFKTLSLWQNAKKQ